MAKRHLPKPGKVKPVIVRRGDPDYNRFSIIEHIQAYQGPRETLIDTARRLILQEALFHHGGHNGHTAFALGLQPRMVSYWRAVYHI